MQSCEGNYVSWLILYSIAKWTMGIIVPNYKNKSNKNSGEKYRMVRLNSCPESNKYVLLEQYDHLGR